MRFAWLALSVLLTVSCSSPSPLAPFSSDGCSLFPDRSLLTEADWCDCCFAHDIAYWRGGTAVEREAADVALKDCVLERSGDSTLAALMYRGVRAGGSPYFVTWYRWGYGWGQDKKYNPLTTKELARADELLDDYYASNSEAAVCETQTNSQSLGR